MYLHTQQYNNLHCIVAGDIWAIMCARDDGNKFSFGALLLVRVPVVVSLRVVYMPISFGRRKM